MNYAKLILIIGVVAVVSTLALLALSILRLSQLDKEKNTSQTANARAKRWPNKEPDFKPESDLINEADPIQTN